MGGLGLKLIWITPGVASTLTTSDALKPAADRSLASINAPPALAAQAESMGEVEQRFALDAAGPRAWARVLRLHQWLKNLLIFVPLLAIVAWKTQAILARGGAEPHILRDAAYVTIGIFTALTLSVFLSRKDFSFLRSGLMMASGAALSAIVLALTFGFSLGLVFSVAMVLLAAGYVLYQTSQVLAHYDPRQHVAAALALFSSVALMFWYVIRIFLRARD